MVRLKRLSEILAENTYIVVCGSLLVFLYEAYKTFVHKTAWDYVFVFFIAFITALFVSFVLIAAMSILSSALLVIFEPLASLNGIFGGDFHRDGSAVSAKAIRKMLEKEKNISYCNIRFQ